MVPENSFTKNLPSLKVGEHDCYDLIMRTLPELGTPREGACFIMAVPAMWQYLHIQFAPSEKRKQLAIAVYWTNQLRAMPRLHRSEDTYAAWFIAGRAMAKEHNPTKPATTAMWALVMGAYDYAYELMLKLQAEKF